MKQKHRRQAGFSMVEMLLAAFIMAIGLLGLTMLQTMAIRTNTGSRARNEATHLAESLLEQIQSEGRYSISQTRVLAAVGTLPHIRPALDPIQEYYTLEGNRLPVAGDQFFTATVTPVELTPAVAGYGGSRYYTVNITYSDGVDANNAPIQRQVSLGRQVAYAL